VETMCQPSTLLCMGGYSASLSQAHCVGTLKQQERDFVTVILRVLKEIGAFYVVAHGVSSDLFSTLQATLGELPYKNDAEAEDSSFKTNRALAEKQKGKYNPTGECPFNNQLSGEVWRNLVNPAFCATEGLACMLLHAMAFGQQLCTGQMTEWRNAWADPKYQSIGYRVLGYHPGPAFKENKERVVTTARHTDATWVTILANDGVGGLMVRPPSLGKWIAVQPPFQGALLVNTGNVMAKASDNFYGAVCHYVQREEGARTRVSMPFFYDRAKGDKYHGGGTGGC